MSDICSFINIHSYTILPKYKYFTQDLKDTDHYIGGNISITSHIINKLASINNIIEISDINDECGIVVFRYLHNGRLGSICEVKSNGIHYWLVNIFTYV